MWNLHYSNRKCNEIEKIKDHKRHLERIVTVRPMLDVKAPVKPGFLTKRSKKEATEKEFNDKVSYENKVLLGKIIEIENKPSSYNPVLLLPSRCPAFDKTTFQIKKKKFEIDKENIKLYNRLVSAKPHYKTDLVIKDYIQSRYYESMLSKTKNNVNPSLMFETPSNFRKKIDLYMSNSQFKNDLVEDLGVRSFSSTNMYRVPSATVKSFNNKAKKKPLSGMSKASTNTNYMSHVKSLDD